MTRSILVELRHGLPVVEAGLRHILEEWPDFELWPLPPAAAHAPWQERTPDVTILDHDRALQMVMDRSPTAASSRRILVVAMMGHELDVRGAVEAGIRGYVVTDCPTEEIVRAARAVAAGQRYLCTAASLCLADKLGQPALTLRENEVLSLAMRGQSNKEMARSLAISVGTVKAHMRTLFSKLGARCRTEALWLASEKGLISTSQLTKRTTGAWPQEAGWAASQSRD